MHRKLILYCTHLHDMQDCGGAYLCERIADNSIVKKNNNLDGTSLH